MIIVMHSKIYMSCVSFKCNWSFSLELFNPSLNQHLWIHSEWPRAPSSFALPQSAQSCSTFWRNQKTQTKTFLVGSYKSSITTALKCPPPIESSSLSLILKREKFWLHCWVAN